MDPGKSVIYRQSDVPETAEMMWLLSCFTSKGDLDRGHAVKAAANRGEAVSAGVYLYPLLQAADVLGVRATRVPAGPDQAQHIELARQIARRVNARLGDTLLPEPVLASPPSVEAVPGTDGKRKMSSQNDNTISIFEDEAVILDEINSIASLPIPIGSSVQEEESTVAQFVRILAGDEADAAVEQLTSGRIGFRQAKSLVYELFMSHFAEARTQYLRLLDDEPLLEWVLADGAARARTELSSTVVSLKDALGI
jgi:tryptophanyl-tRNA synthetase